MRTSCVCGLPYELIQVDAYWIDGTNYDPPVRIEAYSCPHHGTYRYLIPDHIDYNCHSPSAILGIGVMGPQLAGKRVNTSRDGTSKGTP